MSIKNENKRSHHSTETEETKEAPVMRDAIANKHTSEEVTNLLGFSVSEPLGTSTIRRLRKALPGSASVLKDAKAQLEAEEGGVNVRGITVATMQTVLDERKKLSDAEAILEVAQRSAYEQRLLVDDRSIAMLRKLNNAVNSSGDFELQRRWKFLRDYLGAFAGGGSTSKVGGDEETTSPEPAVAPAVKTV